MHETKRILLIDDEEVITFGFAAVLREPGMEVDCAQTAEGARNLISGHQYNAAIVDLRLSNSIEMEGLECIRHLRCSQVACAILVLTAYGDPATRERVKVLGADFFYEKPMAPMAIKQTLKKFGVYGDIIWEGLGAPMSQV
jgi:DNA-binding response OmpR family regulator